MILEHFLRNIQDVLGSRDLGINISEDNWTKAVQDIRYCSINSNLQLIQYKLSMDCTTLEPNSILSLCVTFVS